MKKYLVGVIVATTAVAGYCLYKYFKESPKKRRKSSNNVAKVSLVKVNDILTRLKEGVSVAFASFYPRSILCAIKPEEVEETIETVFKAFNDVIESNMQALCEESGIDKNDFLESLDIYAEDDEEEEPKSYKEGIEIMKELMKDPTNPNNHLSKDYTEKYIEDLSRELLSRWKEECDKMVDEICIENQLTHFQLTQMLMNGNIADTTYRDIIVRMHNRYKRIMKEISIKNKKNELELYSSFTCYITSHSKLFLIPQECGDIAAHRLFDIITPFKSETKLTVEETMNNIKIIFEDRLKENKDLILKKMNDEDDDENKKKTMSDIFKDDEIKKSSLNIYCKEYDNEEEEKNIKESLYNLKCYVEDNDNNSESNEIKTMINDLSVKLDIPYKFVMNYLTCSYEIMLLSENQKNALFIDGNIIDTQSVVSCAFHLSQENNKSAAYELIKNYVNIQKDENNELYRMVKNERNTKLKSLLDIFSISEDSFNVLNIVLFNDTKRSEWCVSVVNSNNQHGSRKINETFSSSSE